MHQEEAQEENFVKNSRKFTKIKIFLSSIFDNLSKNCLKPVLKRLKIVEKCAQVRVPLKNGVFLGGNGAVHLVRVGDERNHKAREGKILGAQIPI